jgi:hypothetical protein
VTSENTSPKAPYFGRRHPMAPVAKRLCVAHLANLAPDEAVPVLLSGVACGACFEQAIRDDEDAVVLFGVPREIEPDPSYVDEVAVERALGGEDVPLTPVERAVVAQCRREIEREAAEFADRGWLSVTEARQTRRAPVDFKGRPRAPIFVSLADEGVAA